MQLKLRSKNLYTIDVDLVDAQQARRVLDRLVGYSISPIFWQQKSKRIECGPCSVSSIENHHWSRKDPRVYTWRILEYQ